MLVSTQSCIGGSHIVRSTLLLLFCFAAIGIAGARSSAAERAWKTGTWAESPDAKTFAIESATEIIRGEMRTDDTVPLSTSPGTSVQYAVEQQTLFILDSAKVEHALRLLGTAPKYSKNYGATGGGHYITAVAPGGTRLTLEDGSRWDIDVRQHFRVADWQAEDLISVRRSNDDPAFAYEVDNTSRDEGVLANLLAR